MTPVLSGAFTAYERGLGGTALSPSRQSPARLALASNWANWYWPRCCGDCSSAKCGGHQARPTLSMAWPASRVNSQAERVHEAGVIQALQSIRPKRSFFLRHCRRAGLRSVRSASVFFERQP